MNVYLFIYYFVSILTFIYSVYCSMTLELLYQFRENLSLLPISKYITNTNTLLPFLPQPWMSFFATGYPRKSLDVRVEKGNV